MARRPAKPKTSLPRAAAESSPWRYAVPAAAVWLALFAAFFFTRTLQNNGQLDRATLALLLPEFSALPADDGGLPSGLRYLPQRFDLIATAGLIAAGAWGLGGLLLRLIELGIRRVPAGYGTGGAGGALASVVGLERLIIATGLGLSAWSLVTLGFGLAGWLSRPLSVGVLLAVLTGEAVLSVRDARPRPAAPNGDREGPSRGFALMCLAVMAPFLIAAALGAMLPPVDFDVKEYHLGGPKEWYLDGRVHFLPHNVYTSFPFLTEMLSLSAMVVRGDWFRGALAGQLLLAGFMPLTAATVFTIGRRLFGATAGLVGAVVYVTTPWAYRIAVIAYAEGGLTCYVGLSLFAVVVATERIRAGEPAGRSVLLTGLFAGSAMACKYPGVVQVVVPIGLCMVGAAWSLRRVVRDGLVTTVNTEVRPSAPLTPGPSPQGEGSRMRSAVRAGIIYSLGVLLAVGPWLVKNAVETGNPVYPLLWSMFGGRDWDADLNAKWKRGHSPPHYKPEALAGDLKNVAAGSDWQSVLVFGLAPLALLSGRRAAGWLWAYVAFLLAAWWLLTHRIDRFWVPLLPAACVLAGAGAAWAEDLPRRLGDNDLGVSLRWIWRGVCGVTVALAAMFNLLLDTSPLGGNPNYLADLDAVAKTAETPGLAALKRVLPDGSKVLLVGEAATFDARVPVLYNTVFDRSLFEEWTGLPRAGVPKEQWPLRPADEIRRTFAEKRVTHVLVNWPEVLRYRTTYGFTPYVTSERFAELQRAGVLGGPAVLNVVPAASLDRQVAAEAERSFPTLFRGSGESRALIAYELYPVVAN